MRRHILLLLFIIQTAAFSNAGTKLDFTSADRLTFRYFEEKKWDSVILIGKQALRQDIDYYYLRVRMGIAYFEKQKYMPAIVHLEKARRFNSGDPMVSEYLYRAYISSNRNEEAGILKATLTKDADVPGSQKKILERVHFESGYTISSNNGRNVRNLMGKDNIFGEQDLYGNNLYENLALKFRLSNRVSISAAYNYFNFTRTLYHQYGRAEDHLADITDTIGGKRYHYQFPWVTSDTNFTYQVNQHEVYLSGSIALPLGFKLMPAVHWILVSYPAINPRIQKTVVQDTGFYSYADQVYHTFPFTRITYNYTRKDTSFSNWLASLMITKDIGRFNLGISGSWSGMNNKTQYQAGFDFTWYPLGTVNFYGTSSVTGFFQGNDTRLLLSQVVGGRIFSRLWLEGNFYYGDYTNANIFNGSVVYNNDDIITYRAGANLDFVISNHLVLSLAYQYFQKKSLQLYYVRIQDPFTHQPVQIPRTKNNPYNTNTIIGGITWKL